MSGWLFLDPTIEVVFFLIMYTYYICMKEDHRLIRSPPKEAYEQDTIPSFAPLTVNTIINFCVS